MYSSHIFGNLLNISHEIAHGKKGAPSPKTKITVKLYRPLQE